jgi:hypothetical protein
MTNVKWRWRDWRHVTLRSLSVRCGAHVENHEWVKTHFNSLWIIFIGGRRRGREGER